MSNTILRTFCWHKWNKWSDPFTGTWTHREVLDGETTNEVVTGYMTQRRMCDTGCKVGYLKCT